MAIKVPGVVLKLTFKKIEMTTIIRQHTEFLFSIVTGRILLLFPSKMSRALMTYNTGVTGHLLVFDCKLSSIICQVYAGVPITIDTSIYYLPERKAYLQVVSDVAGWGSPRI